MTLTLGGHMTRRACLAFHYFDHTLSMMPIQLGKHLNQKIEVFAHQKVLVPSLSAQRRWLGCQRRFGGFIERI